MGTYILTGNPGANMGMDTTEYERICTEVRRMGRSKATWTVGYIRSDDQQKAQRHHGDLTGPVILLRQGGDRRERGIIAFGQRLAGRVALRRGHAMMRIEAPVQFSRAAKLDEEPLITVDQLKQHGFPQKEGSNFPSSGREIQDDKELAALESCCMEVCGISLSTLCSAPGNGSDASRRGTWSTTPDAVYNACVEKAAVECVLRHFIGRESTDRQRDNCGWDYEFAIDGLTYCVEIKGLSGAEIHAELTPNEFKAMERAMNGTFGEGCYRLAVVCEALSEAPKLFLFAHDTGMGWLCEDNQRRITAFRRVAARLE